MSGSLVKIQEVTVTSSTASVSLTGIDTTYDVYKLIINNLVPSADDAPLFRVTKSGVAQADANYDYATFYHKSDTSSQILSGTNGTGRDIMATLDDASGHAGGNGNGVYYLYNFPNASGYSYVTMESSHFQASVHNVRGFNGGFVHTVASACDGVNIQFNNYSSGSTIESGTFRLYGLKK